MPHIYLTRTVHLPATADGTTIKNSFGVVIATAADPTTAWAIARILNLGERAAKEQDAAFDGEEDAATAMFAKSRKG